MFMQRLESTILDAFEKYSPCVVKRTTKKICNPLVRNFKIIEPFCQQEVLNGLRQLKYYQFELPLINGTSSLLQTPDDTAGLEAARFLWVSTTPGTKGLPVVPSAKSKHRTIILIFLYFNGTLLFNGNLLLSCLQLSV